MSEPRERTDAETLRDAAQVLRDVRWSETFDVLRYETFTPHARAVLADASDVLDRVAAAMSSTPSPQEPDDA